MKPVAEACLRNQAPIAEAVREPFAYVKTVLEIGAGTGQHAVYIAERMPHLQWLPTDLAEALPGICAWVEESGLDNLLPPKALDVTTGDWELSETFDAAYTSNTLHFVGWTPVEALFAGVAKRLRAGSPFCVYGPFNENGVFTSPGNQGLDEWVKTRDPDAGLKDLADIEALALRYGFKLKTLKRLPANNLLLVFCFEG
ncbi:DUF938 domain-containing protein [Hahella sp. KA22]|uniref:DUF938 domain-containing protein n=1 Tax=Hahella sp. KA22 TaxID=1628392 RepID=UPI000FDEDB13|nr:DUF938 domain-containing protein [Hahella sp. KA22]AZZ91107.1 DUF938 domain-containing protein [Hahella sp. KA22]QAY54476.1 DUF938 domain-containing protein [Hahella sp. KA22]